jgi:hypothetical protein
VVAIREPGTRLGTAYILCERTFYHTLTCHSSEAEHADLLHNVVPGARGLLLTQLVEHLVPDVLDSVCHQGHLFLPVRQNKSFLAMADASSQKEKKT